MTTYITKDGETLDYICWLTYGKTSGVVEQVLTANRHLSEESAVLTAGIKIELPEIETKSNQQKIKLWG